MEETPSTNSRDRLTYPLQSTSDNEARDRLKRIKHVNKVIKALSLVTIKLAVVLLGTGTAEAIIDPCNKYKINKCHYKSIGQAVWCSIIPLIAGTFGVQISSNYSSKTQVSLTFGFNVAGAVTTFLLVILQPIVAKISIIDLDDGKSVVLLVLQIFITLIAFVNLIVLLVCASYIGCNKRNFSSERVVYNSSYSNWQNDSDAPTYSNWLTNSAYQPKLSQMVPMPKPFSNHDDFTINTDQFQGSPPKYDELSV